MYVILAIKTNSLEWNYLECIDEYYSRLFKEEILVLITTYLEPLSITTFNIGQPSSYDLFNRQGILLLTKGKPITTNIQELLQRRQIYTLKYDLNKSQDPNITHKFSESEYQDIVVDVREAFENAGLISSERLHKTFLVVDKIINELEGTKRVYLDLNKFRKFDNNTYIHSVNVAILATLIGLQMNFTGQALRDLTLGAMFHDIGKSAIPIEVLNKTSKLTDEELEIIKKHPILGEEMLRKSNITGEVLTIVRHHHERCNGKGYPDAVRQSEIGLNAQIVAITDVFDALVDDRPYRKGLPPYHALEIIIAESNEQFNKEIVNIFIQCLILYPEGSIVTLNTAEVGIVIGIHQTYPSRPLVKILFDKDGNYLHDDYFCDLSQDLTKFIKSVDFRSVP
ncbi:HD-GYP domain-containing protein [Desulfosporosinus fructosivorans]|uniref:HD-GYP domain-containing protein n=1 Tax=Desulfosporosinus fructosivorans TaxID=2018669 RepID=A0A4Z0R9A1_9FIRM|nr:HD-GYP domain-containing protein [Desulfosporosinus fructosivorans]